VSVGYLEAEYKDQLYRSSCGVCSLPRPFYTWYFSQGALLR